MSQIPVFKLRNHDKYSETQRDLLTMFGDGQAHFRDEIKKVLLDPEASDHVPGAHVRALRKAMELHDPAYTIVTQIGIFRRISYIMVRRVNISDE